ncbi:sirohydrochlorin ferrochelatase [Saccharothrix tamanrassetensis]|uniref:Sirohydrochlorin ferrochelatase n=1 Tax=Saccharothrix tamanrassetensis TaxID=1051531 RepID=A0A841CL18_9PSEU|nr:sirohydrochlorin chelatase [Saccharothrix tamanrassetensis]MBB5957780.1 sirohydrochlorin ferrochelatase [Saccharothrix tamanrassetensis]
MTALVAVAHGSRDPRSAATVHALLDVVRALRPSLDVRGSFLDLSAPRLGDVLRAVRGAGHRSAVVVPLLLGKAFHARVDVPSAVAEARLPSLDVTIADVLGPDPRLESAALRRLASVGVGAERDWGVVLAGAGSSHAPANALVSSIARRWARESKWSGVEAAFASTASPDVPTAVERLRAGGALRIAVASWFLAPGLLPDRVAASAGGDAVIAPPLGPDPEVAELVLHRFESAVASDLAVQSA